MTDTPCRTYARTGLTNTIFPEYRQIIGQWNNYYSNYKWPDHGARCTWLGESESNSEDNSDSSSSSIGQGRRGRKGGRMRKKPPKRITRGGAVRKTSRGSSRGAITFVR